jgi:hypothetical protein
MHSDWILNCVVKQFDIHKALQNQAIMTEGMTWMVTTRLKEIKVNDNFYLYLTKPHQKIIAKGKIVEPPERRYCDEISAEFWNDAKKESLSNRIWIEFDSVLDDGLIIDDVNPAGTHDSMEIPVGRQGFNHLIPQIAKARLARLFSEKEIEQSSETNENLDNANI